MASPTLVMEDPPGPPTIGEPYWVDGDNAQSHGNSFLLGQRILNMCFSDTTPWYQLVSHNALINFFANEWVKLKW